jgi:hypothetical protein
MKNKSLIISSICVVAFAFCAPLNVSAKEKKSEASPAASASPSAAASMKSIGFHGTVTSVDQNAKTFTLSGKSARVIKVTDKTTVTKDGNPATMSDITENEKVTGAYWKNADGSLEGRTVTLGARPEKEKTKKKSKKDKEEEASPSPTP